MKMSIYTSIVRFLAVMICLSFAYGGDVCDKSVITLKMGEPEFGNALGYGWGEPRFSGTSASMRWITHMEGEVSLPLESPASMSFFMKARPRYVSWRRQSVGLWVNGRFVDQWECPDEPSYHIYTTDIPERFLRSGINRLILRCGYLYDAEDRDVEHALGVEEITFIRNPE